MGKSYLLSTIGIKRTKLKKKDGRGWTNLKKLFAREQSKTTSNLFSELTISTHALVHLAHRFPIEIDDPYMTYMLLALNIFLPNLK